MDAGGNLYVTGSYCGSLVLGDSPLTSDNYEIFEAKLSPVTGPALPHAPDRTLPHAKFSLTWHAHLANLAFNNIRWLPGNGNAGPDRCRRSV